MTDVTVSQKVIRYETFVNDVLREDLKKVLQERDSICAKLAEYLQLRNMIDKIQRDTDLCESKKPLKTKVDLGCNFYVQAKVPKVSHIFLHVGLGFHVEFTLQEALAFIEKKEKMLNAELQKLTKDSAKIKANIKLVLEGLRELQGIPSDIQTPRERDVTSF